MHIIVYQSRNLGGKVAWKRLRRETISSRPRCGLVIVKHEMERRNEITWVHRIKITWSQKRADDRITVSSNGLADRESES